MSCFVQKFFNAKFSWFSMFSDRQYVAVSIGNLGIFTSKNKDGAQEKKRDKLGVHVAEFFI